jgi:Uncharacterized protein conserved in bacteria (DUF2188)
MKKNVHVVPSDSGWDVKVEGRGSSRHFQTQTEAIRAGRELARGNHSENIIHGRDGRIRQRDSYGRDPFPPRG